MGNITEKEYNTITYGWSKYRPKQVKSKKEYSWTCQTCGEEQPLEVPHYFVPIDQTRHEFLRICSVCKHIQLENKLGKYDYARIILIVRKELPYG